MHAFFPRHCALCAAPSLDRPLCAACDADLPRHSIPVCPICALPALDGHVCGSCLRHPPAFGHTLAAFSYGFPIDRLLQAFKYAGSLALAEALAEPLAHLAAKHPKPELLLPMPLHPARLKERGFNQALEIARPISRRLDIPLAADACRRTRDTPSQAGLKWQQRRGNVRGAFACDLDLTGKKVAILDDVMTTGSTLDELSRVLLKRGAAEVSAWVVARTLKE
ncbi:MAG: ComF family protein [Sulfuricella sp.]|nr:ComF family protein [Sulfuricella sp.]